jgi:peptidoglycan hydrolase-like protein with peptidoglycan-binding domain
VWIAALAAAAVAGAVIAISIQGGAVAPAAAPPPAVSTAVVVRTNLSSTVLTAGTLGYVAAPPLVNQLSGTYTWLPTSGTVIPAGGVLYRIDNFPVVVMNGATPAWRGLALGVADGPDVAELQANLIALGDADGLLSSPTGHFDLLTADAVERWQESMHEPLTGAIAFGQVAFLPAPVRAGTGSLAAGEAASPGQTPYQLTTTGRAVTVPLNPTLPGVRGGERVMIVLGSGAGTPGTITQIGPAQATVTPARPAATGTGASVGVQVSLPTQSVHDALAVPVSALLALAGGGYALEVVEPSGTHRLVGVTTGIYGGGRVQVRGAGIAAGTRVVVSQ